MIISIVGTRPNFVKLAPISNVAIERKIEHKIIHTGQHYDYELSKDFFETLRIPEPDEYLGIGSGRESYQIGETIIAVSRVLQSIKNPSAVLVYGDTNATVGGAIGAKKEGFFVCHIESGVRTGDRRLPEETNRVISEACSDLLFAPTKHTFNNIVRTQRAFLVGDVMFDTLNWARPLINDSQINEFNLVPKEYILLTLHRGINVDSPNTLERLLKSLDETNENFIFPVHPRTEKSLRSIQTPPSIRIIKPLGYLTFLSLLKNAKKVVTDSGGVQKEAYSFGIPCVTLLDAYIWPETIEAGWNFPAGQDNERITKGITEFWPKKRKKQIFGNGHAAEKILDIVFSNNRNLQ